MLELGSRMRTSAVGALILAALYGGACGRSDDVIGGGVAGAGPVGGAGGAGGLDPTIDFEPCAEVHDEASLVPVNMFLTVDKSGSMDEMGKWDSAVAAFTAFFNDPEAASLRVALRLWPLDSDGCNDMDCDADACSQPDVVLGELGDAAHRQALIDELMATMPDGGTPMSAALEGAVAFAEAQLAAAPEEKVVIVLVTDGEPQGCNEDIAAIAALAADGFAAGAPVFVVGIEGSAEMQIDQIAMAGGTTGGYFVGSANAEEELLLAMQDIQGQSVACSFPFPEEDPAQPLAPELMRIEYDSGSGTLLVPRVSGADACTDAGGWYLDDPANPMTITLCPTTCSEVQGNVEARVDIAVGCECTVDEDCPEGNVCDDHHCVPPCTDDSQCDAGEICHDGHCIPEPGDPCTQDPDCPEPLVCIGEQCSLGTVIVGAEEAVQGGAFACNIGSRADGRWALLSGLALGGLALAGLARRRRWQG
jgi:hypothetical protein